MNDVIVVTGGAGGIGRAVVEHLLRSRESAIVVAIDRSFDDPSVEQAPPHDRLRKVSCDIGDQESVRSTIELISREGRIVGLVNLAGNLLVRDSLELTRDDVDSVLGVHVYGALFASQAVARAMIAHGGGGSIVNCSSVARQFGWPRRLAYAMAKSAVVSLTTTLAVEWAEHGIRVNAVAPGYVQTEMLQRGIELGAFDRSERERQHALMRVATPDEIASPIAYLLSEASSFVTGATIDVDGGFSIFK